MNLGTAIFDENETNRKQQVVVDGVASNETEVTSGVPEGTFFIILLEGHQTYSVYLATI